MHITFLNQNTEQYYPLTLTKPIIKLRLGITTLEEKWISYTKATGCSYIVEEYLSKKFPLPTQDTLFINSCIIAHTAICDKVLSMKNGDVLFSGEEIIAYKGNYTDYLENKFLNKQEFQIDPIYKLEHITDLFTKNNQQIRFDFHYLTTNRTSKKIDDTNTIIGNDIFIEEGASVSAATINTTLGPVYIGKDAQIMEGSVIRGPFALCHNATLKMASKIYSGTTIGPHSKTGGELNNVNIQGYTNKAHDGFLGNSVIGEWCNLGADTNNSNLKNNYAEVKLWNYPNGRFSKTGLQFCGLVMGDHAKCGINTMFNTGTVVGVGSNVFGANFPRNFIPSFSWGGAAKMTEYRIDKMIEVAKIVMKRRDIDLNEVDEDILHFVYKFSEQYRNY